MWKGLHGETKRCLGTRLKEHKDACVGGHTHKSAIAKHAWAEGHPINWSGTKILQRASHMHHGAGDEGSPLHTVHAGGLTLQQGRRV